MKSKRLLAICMTAIVSASGVFSVSVSADSVPDFRTVYEISDKVYALWEECGISISDVQKIYQTRTSYIQDYGCSYYCSYNYGTLKYAHFTNVYDVSKVPYYDILPVYSVTGEDYDSLGNIITHTFTTSFSNAGKVISFKASRSSASYNINDSNVIDISYSSNATLYSSGWIPLGDVNDDGSVDISDYIAVSNFVVEAPTGTPFITERADVNMDGSINATDVSLINQYIAKLVPHIWGNS